MRGGLRQRPLTTFARRGALTRFVDRHPVAWEGSMAALTALYIALSMFENDAGFVLGPLTVFLYSLSALFALEFTARWWDAPHKYSYFRAHWLDLITSIPLVGPLRVLRLLRLLRFMRLGLAIRSVVLKSRVDNSWLICPFLTLFWIGSAYGLWLAEHSVNPAIATFNSALLYSFLTACTVGYGSFTPVSIEGKVISGLIVFVAIGLIGFTSARLTTMFLAQENERLPRQITTIERDLADIKVLLTQLVSSGDEVAIGSDFGRN